MRNLIRALAICLLPLAPPVLAANPFAPALTVNDSVITHYDIEQRIKLLDALGANGDLAKVATQQLTEDRVKVEAARELEIELPEGAIDAGIEEFATGRGLTTEDVYRVLTARGIDRQAMDDFVESGLMWREVVGARRSGFEMSGPLGSKRLSRDPSSVQVFGVVAGRASDLTP